MASTYTYAIITKDGRSLTQTREVKLQRRNMTGWGYYIEDDSHYEIHTVNGPIMVQGPLWILYDVAGFPYPCDAETFESIWEKA